MIHYKKKKSNPFFWPTVVVLCLLIFFSYHHPATTSLPSKVLNTALSPLNSAFYYSSEKLHQLYNSVFGNPATQAEVARLGEENAKYKEENLQLKQVIGQSDALINHMRLLKKAPEGAIQAHVSAMDPSNRFTRFTINKGKKDGVREGDVIVQGNKNPKSIVVEALVGRVTEVGPNYAKVSSLQDQLSNISVMFSASGGYGIINNRDQENLYGYLLDPTISVESGEAAFSSGIGGVYPRGLYIGRVSNVEVAGDGLTKKFTVTTSVDFNQLYWVLVLNPDEIDQTMEIKIKENAKSMEKDQEKDKDTEKDKDKEIEEELSRETKEDSSEEPGKEEENNE